jgi:spermidine/putrescine transport system ATP-binding protein
MNNFLAFENISKKFGSTRAVDGVSLSIDKGEIYSLLGPSGCGKTTLLRIAAGFEKPDTGRVILNGEDITELPPNQRKVNTIFQNYALFPHLSVWENIAFGLRMARRSEHEITAEVERMLHLVQMEEHAHKRPGLISGGQKQRVAIARALINKPQVLLLDEPLGALDLKLRQRMLIELDSIHDEVGITFLYVTHDQGEAMSLSDRIAVMNRGRIEQIGKPTTIYEAPRSSFVAAFIGDTNFFDGTVSRLVENDHCMLSIKGLPDVICYNDSRISAGSRVVLTVRPEKFSISRRPPEPKPLRNPVLGTVEDVVYLGTHTKFWVRVDDHRIAVDRHNSRFLLDEEPITWKEQVWISFHADDGYMLESFSEDDERLLDLPTHALAADGAPAAPGGPA